MSLMEQGIYKEIEPPFATLRFREMSKRDLREYGRWFLEVIPDRISVLADIVKQSPGFENWCADYTPKSLDVLGKWLSTQIKLRPRTEEEMHDIAERLPYPEYVSNKELTNRTISLGYDVSMYLSQVFLRNHSSLTWDQIFGSRRFIDYGEPVLVGFYGKVPFNPRRMVATLLYGLAKDSEAGSRLREIYDIWSARVA